VQLFGSSSNQRFHFIWHANRNLREEGPIEESVFFLTDCLDWYFFLFHVTIWSYCQNVTSEDLEQFLDERMFRPFVLTTVDGFALPITDPRKTLIGLSMVVIKHTDGRLYHVPFHKIAHISEAGKELG